MAQIIRTANIPTETEKAALPQIVAGGTLDGDRLPALSAGKKGGVPATGTPSGLFLKDDGTWSAAGGTFDLPGAIHAAADKPTPVDADQLVISDSAASWVVKSVTWTNVKVTAKAYFDTLYPLLAAKNVFTATLSAATGNEIALTLNYATNKAAGDDTGLLIAMTDTASPGTSYPLHVQKNGTTDLLRLDQGGSIYLSGNLTANAVYTAATEYSSGSVNIRQYETNTGNLLECHVNQARTNTSGTSAMLAITSAYNQTSGTAVNTDLLINRTQTAVGSGAQLLIDAQVSNVSKFSVTNTGVVVGAQYRLAALNTAPANAGDTGTLGEIRVVADYLYVCTATNTWVRAALATW